MYDDVIRTVENGRPVGTIVKGKLINGFCIKTVKKNLERKLANDNENILIFTNRIVETGLECERRFKRVTMEPIMY